MHKMHKPTGTTRMTRLLAQLPVILVESTCKSMVLVENEWQKTSKLLWNVSMRKCNAMAGDDISW